MRIVTLEVSNFRAIEQAILTSLPRMIVIAGPNGCGKSCLFDAIRLLKSAYGGYQPNEWQSWFGEFQINLDRSQPELLSLFRRKTEPVRIAAAVALEEVERNYLIENAHDLLRPGVWERITGSTDVRRGRNRPVAAQIRHHGRQVEEEIMKEADALRNELKQKVFAAELFIAPNLSISISPSSTLQALFSLFHPERLGIIDYHSAQRSYVREQVGGINLSIESTEQQHSQHALYNFAAKYQNIKTQMAAGYIRELLSKQAQEQTDSSSSLIETLKEMFQLFFPDKEFLGPRPTSDGRLLFPVRTHSGAEHDINDLSSGEKDVLYGYLRLRNVSPKNSVLLLDEPELHLNPRLIQGLPQFYHRHLGHAFGNQIWLLTHSDALLREAVGHDDFAVYHMQQPGLRDGSPNQLRIVSLRQDVERAVVDLVGDLAGYRPGAKVVIFEGGGDTDFDVSMTFTLFPEFATAVNMISGTNKRRVRELHELLESAAQKAALPAHFYSIVDRDSDDLVEESPANALSWDVYHIENYLLSPRFVLSALVDALGTQSPLRTEQEIEVALSDSAEETVNGVAAEQLERWANRLLVTCIRKGSDPASISAARDLRKSIEGSLQRVVETCSVALSAVHITDKEVGLRDSLAQDLSTGMWRSTFRGRDVLARFTTRFVRGVSYQVFRNLIIAKMRDAEYKPEGMKAVIDRIMDSGATAQAGLADEKDG